MFCMNLLNKTIGDMSCELQYRSLQYEASVYVGLHLIDRLVSSTADCIGQNLIFVPK